MRVVPVTPRSPGPNYGCIGLLIALAAFWTLAGFTLNYWSTWL